jgi:hypothetical protein
MAARQQVLGGEKGVLRFQRVVAAVAIVCQDIVLRSLLSCGCCIVVLGVWVVFTYHDGEWCTAQAWFGLVGQQ